jgi:hypothetical protein
VTRNLIIASLCALFIAAPARAELDVAQGSAGAMVTEAQASDRIDAPVRSRSYASTRIKTLSVP